MHAGINSNKSIYKPSVNSVTYTGPHTVFIVTTSVAKVSVKYNDQNHFRSGYPTSDTCNRIALGSQLVKWKSKKMYLVSIMENKNVGLLLAINAGR